MNAPVFASTGPLGHRARMRDRLLSRGGGGLADYEVVEMLLFLGIRRGDTKPLAKQLINRFGSLGAVLDATPRALAEAEALPLRAALPLRMAAVAAERLARAEIRARPILGSLATVSAYLAGTEAAGTRLLLLDNRNRLLADEASPLDADAAPASIRACLRRALEHHAAAMLLVDRETSLPAAALLDARAEAARRGRDAAALLSVTLHDRLAVTADGLRSFRAEGRLG